MSLKDFAQAVCKEVWGFVPNREIKPVHLANGFFRAVSGATSQPKLLHKASGAFQKGQSKTTTEQLREDLYQENLLTVSNTSHELDRLRELRSALDLVLSQDRGVFRTDRNYSFTLTNSRQSSSDTSDIHTGRFLASILTASSPQQIEGLAGILEASTDDISILTYPLLPSATQNPALRPGPDEATRRVLNQSPILQQVQIAFENLYRYSSMFEKTAFLQRIVGFGSFGIFLHLANAGLNRGESPQVPWVPALLCADSSDPLLRETSRATFVRAKRQVEIAFEMGIGVELAKRGQDQLSRAQYLDLVRVGDFRSDATFSAFERDFEAELAAGSHGPEAFQRALVQAAFQEVGYSDPIRFMTSLGRLGGLLFPRAQGRGEKYYVPTPEFLDMLVISLLEPGEELQAAEFWDRAYKTYGVVCGAQSFEDAHVLNQWGIHQVQVEALRRNSERIEQELARMGHARKYADGVAVIFSRGAAA